MITFSLGAWTATVLRDTDFWIDAGTLFGIVPRPLWERHVQPDGKNRTPVALNSLLLRGEGRCLLLDAGIGDKLPERERRIYNLDPDRTLLRSLAEAGAAPEDVDTVVLSHLHLDHTGWMTRRDAAGRPVPTFPRARYVVQKAEWNAAHATNALTRGSYVPDDFDPPYEAGRVDLVDGTEEIAPGVTVERTGGHAPGHQVVHVDSGGERLLCPFEIVPTLAHLRLAWVMSYDEEPVRVVDIKSRLMREAAERGSRVFLGHERTSPVGRFVASPRPDEYGWRAAAPS